MKKNVAILCASRNSIYKTIPGCDVYDIDRDARTFPGQVPVVAHPMCRCWGNFSQLAKATDLERLDEMMLGLFCARQVRACGGVLEQPSNSGLFSFAGLPSPTDSGQGFTIQVPQYWWGHRGQKETWLWFYGIKKRDLPEMPFELDGPRRIQVEWMSGCRAGEESNERARTPKAFAYWLVECARRSSPMIQSETNL